jgi:hypothetical protein
MAAILEKTSSSFCRMWECKQCHQSINDDNTVAYHLIEGILYGWCETCFSQRAEPDRAIATRAA